jgi:hypothetical protein
MPNLPLSIAIKRNITMVLVQKQEHLNQQWTATTKGGL